MDGRLQHQSASPDAYCFGNTIKALRLKWVDLLETSQRHKNIVTWFHCSCQKLIFEEDISDQKYMASTSLSPGPCGSGKNWYMFSYCSLYKPLRKKKKTCSTFFLPNDANRDMKFSKSVELEFPFSPHLCHCTATSGVVFDPCSVFFSCCKDSLTCICKISWVKMLCQESDKNPALWQKLHNKPHEKSQRVWLVK